MSTLFVISNFAGNSSLNDRKGEVTNLKLCFTSNVRSQRLSVILLFRNLLSAMVPAILAKNGTAPAYHA